MIPILYSADETVFDTNGLGALTDAADCTVEQELNGQYELEMRYPVTGQRFSDLQQRAIILASVDPLSEAQPFRIYRITKPFYGMVTVYARHIAYDLQGVPVAPFTAASVADALNALQTSAATDFPFEVWTDKSTSATMTVSVPTAAWSLLGGQDGSILDVYGGEYEFDRWLLKLHAKRGEDRGVIIRYGKNLQTLEQDENCANCCTGIYPYWVSQDGDLVQLTEKIVPAEGTYDYERVIPVDFSSEWEEEPTEEQLRTRAEKYVADNDIGVPTVSLSLSFVQLEQTEEYKDRPVLERVMMGDTVGVEFPKLGVSASARVVSVKWEPLLDRYDEVTLGKVKSNLAATIVTQEKAVEKKPDMSTIQQRILALADIFTGVKGGAVRLLDTDGDGMPDELYIADNAEPDQAKKVWRFNYLGWAASSSGYSGPFTMGATLEDGILANAVTAASLIAGTIQSTDGESFFLDLDNGLLRIKSTSTTVDGDMIATQEQVKTAIDEIENAGTAASEALAAESQSIRESIIAQCESVRSEAESQLEAYKNDVGQFLSYGDDGLTLGASSSEFKTVIDNLGLYFKQNSTVVAYLNNHQLHIPNAVIEETLYLGDFFFSPRGSDGGFSVTWHKSD